MGGNEENTGENKEGLDKKEKYLGENEEDLGVKEKDLGENEEDLGENQGGRVRTRWLRARIRRIWVR